MRWLEWERCPSPPTFGTRAESNTEVSGSREETRKAVERSSTVTVFNFDRFPSTFPNAQERADLWARISMWSKCRAQFSSYLELGQKRKLVYGLARSVICCFLGSGVLTFRYPLYPEFVDTPSPEGRSRVLETQGRV